MKKFKKIPDFKTEDEEREFWSTHSSVDYIDWSKAVRVEFPNLKLSTTTISLRLTSSLLDDIKRQANNRDIPYQSFIKMILAEKIDELIGRYKKPSKKHSFFRVMEKKIKYKTK